MTSAERLEILKDQINRAFQAKSVYNAEYVGMKANFSRLLEDYNKQAQRVYLDQRPGAADAHNRTFSAEVFQELYYFHPAINSFKKFARLLEIASNLPSSVFCQDQFTRMLAVIAAYQHVYDEFAPLAEKLNALKNSIVKGRAPSTKPRLTDPRTLDHTGTCPICGQNIKLEVGVMVKHGFKIQYGFQRGSCFGVGHKPIEISDSGLKAYIAFLKNHLAMSQDLLEKLPTRKKLYVQDPKSRNKDAVVTVTPEDVEWPRYYRQEEQSLKSEISALKRDLKYREDKLATWAPKPLPDGDRRHLEVGK